MKNDNGQKSRFRDIIAAEKREMLPLNFLFAYRVAPVYVLVSFLLIAGFGILMGIDDERYFIPAMVLMGALVVISVALLACLPYVRKKALEAEMRRYDFDTSDIEVADVWEVMAEGKHLRFNRTGVQIDGVAFDYDNLYCRIATNNYCKRVMIAVWIVPSEEEDGVLLPLTAHTLKMLECLPIPLNNPELLDYVLNHKEDAIRQVYDRGYIKLVQ